MFSPLSAKRVIFISWVFMLSPLLIFSQIYENNENLAVKDSFFLNRKMTNNLIDSNFINSLPLRSTKDFLKYLPGVIEHQGKFHLNGSRYDELDYLLDDFSILDHFSGEQLIDIPKYALKSIGISGQNGIQGPDAISYELKTGVNEFKYSLEHSTDNIGINTTSDFYEGQHRLGSYWYGYNETNFNVQGPIVKDKLTFFANANYQFMRDRNPQLYPGVNDLQLFGLDNQGNVDEDNVYLLSMPKGIVYGNSIQTYNILGKLSYTQEDFSLDITGIFDHKMQDTPRNHVLDYFNKRLGKIENNTGFFSASAKHQISNSFWYNINASYSFKSSETYDEYLKDNFWAYGDSVANAEVGVIWERTEEEIERWNESGIEADRTRFIQPTDYYLNGFSFSGINAIPTNYLKNYSQTISFATNFNYKVNETNIIAFGLNISQLSSRQWSTESWQTNFAHDLYREVESNPNFTLNELKARVIASKGMNNLGYDLLGNTKNDGVEGPSDPLFVGIYLQNRFTTRNLYIDFGIAYDRIDLDAFLLKDVNNWWDSFNLEDGFWNSSPKEDGFKKNPIFTYLSPKIAINFLLERNTNLYFRYGNYISQSKLNDIYTNPRYFLYITNLDFFINSKEITVNNSVKPTITRKIEFEVNHNFSNKTSTSLLGFISNISNQPIVENSNYDYTYLTISNRAETDIGGVTLSLKHSNLKGFQLISNISYLTTDALTHYYREDDQSVYNDIKYVSAPSEYEQSFYTNFLLIQNFEKLFNNISLFNNLIATLSAHFNNGHPYTPSNGFANSDFNPVGRALLYNEVNGSKTPSNFQLNFRLDKLFHISNSISLNFYIYAINLLGNENIKDVFLRTGSAKEDGVLADENLNRELLIEQYGEEYGTLYQLINFSYNPKNTQQTMFGEPRQIIVGINLNL